MEMEFKDNSRRRTLVLVVGVLLALGAGAAAFMLSSQGQEEPETVLPTREVVVASAPIADRATIELNMIELREVPLDDSNASAFSAPEQVANNVAAIPILANQPITPNMLARAGAGALNILPTDDPITAESPVWRAVSISVPDDRAVGGSVQPGQRVDVIATFPMNNVTLPIDPETGQPTGDAADLDYIVGGTSTKLMWLDVPILSRPEGGPYIVRADLQTAEEIAHAQNQGAQFTLALRPAPDTRDVDRSNYGETTELLIERYNFPIPERIDGVEYAQPIAFPSPFPNEPYLDLTASPSPSPDPELIEIDIDDAGTDEGLVGEESDGLADEGTLLEEETPAP